MKKAVLTIAGSDSSGGAGIQGDLKAMSANGVFGMSVISSITAQNTTGVTDVFHLPIQIIEAQLAAIFKDIPVACIKTGMLANADIVIAVSRNLRDGPPVPLVVDPVMVAKGGHRLLDPEAVDVIKRELLPQATLVTPNIYEAETLSNTTIRTLADAREAAKMIFKLGCRHVLIKGGHLSERPGTDLLYDGRFFKMYTTDFIDTPHTHGTGCSFASAIAAHLARGAPMTEAIELAKRYITEAIRFGWALGKGHGPTDHFYFLNQATAT
ncbi:MAG: bifunctional hydroxymethylpyrimidine kinase/phosphomethylpyrimidine kinase [Nitrospirales bacterium]|nr:bifunctional hydroxymethylpyrimidine kinase/phosphomethylpyrimidine kinase [Nitrospirales bacterium]